MTLFGLFGKKKREEIQPIPEMTGPELGLGREHELGLAGREETYPNIPGAGGPHIGAPPGMPPSGAPVSRYAPPAQAEQIIQKDIEILSAKLDALKAILDNINQRLIALERIAREGREHHEKYY